MSALEVSNINISSITPSQLAVTDAVRNLATVPISSAPSTPLAVITRDAAGNFSANIITANLSGTATTTTTNANFTGPISSVGNATSITSKTGSTNIFAMSIAPTISTPTIASIVNSGGTLSVPAGITDTFVLRNTSDALTNKTIVSPTNTVRANLLATTGSSVAMPTAQPTIGKILCATGTTTAVWQDLVVASASADAEYITYSQGTVTQLLGIVTVLGGLFTSDMVGGIITINGISTIILSVLTGLTLTVATSLTISVASLYTITYVPTVTIPSASAKTYTYIADSGLYVAPPPGTYLVIFTGSVASSVAAIRCSCAIFNNNDIEPNSRRDFQLNGSINAITTTATVTAYSYTAGTVSQSGTTVTGTSTLFTSSMVNGTIIINNVQMTIVSVTNSTTLDVDTSQSIGAGTVYEIYLPITVQFAIFGATILSVYDRVINIFQVNA